MAVQSDSCFRKVFALATASEGVVASELNYFDLLKPSFSTWPDNYCVPGGCRLDIW